MAAAVGGFVVSTAPTGVVTHKKCYTTQTSTARKKKCAAAAVGGFVVSEAPFVVSTAPPLTGVVTQKKCYMTQTSTARIKKVCGGRGWWVCCLSSTTYRGCHT